MLTVDETVTGDYDGDEVTVIWQPEIVQNFRNAELCRLPEELKDDFVWAKESVSDFLKRAPLSDSQRHVQEVLPYLLNPVLRQAQISEYNDMHLNSAYMYGYGNRRTQRLGHMYVAAYHYGIPLRQTTLQVLPMP